VRLRRHSTLVSALVVAALGVGCASGPTSGATSVPTTVQAVPAEAELAAFVTGNGLEDLGRATVRMFDRDGRTRLVVAVVIADTPAARTRGLQGVERLPEGVGMLFAFPDRPTSEPRPGFWMLGTAVALDIAFVADGTVVGVATMEPCVVRPCPVTHPGVEYEVALEVVAGSLVAAGVVPGDRFETVTAGYGGTAGPDGDRGGAGAS